MKKLAAILALLMLVAGCSAGNGDQGEAAERDSVNLTINTHLQSVDPHGPRNIQDMLVREQVYEPLVRFNEKTRDITPLLAKDFEANDDGTVYTFELRDDVKFHNGDPMLASDVVFSLKRAMDAPQWSAYTATIADVEATDDHTVVITLKGPSAPFLVNLARLLIVSEREVTEQGDAFGTKVALAGTGPYYFTYLKSDEKWTLEAFPEYYRGEAAIKYVNYVPIVDASAGLISFESGELDWYIAPIANWDSLVSNPDYETELVPANHLTYFAVNYQANDKLADDNIRKAIAYCVDKEAMNMAAFDGHATVAPYLENPQYNIGAPGDGFKYEYNPEKAKELLAEAGYPDGVDVGSILCFPGSHFEKCAQVLQANMEAVGIHAKLELNEQAACLQRNVRQDFDITVSGYNSTGDYDTARLRIHSGAVGSYYVKFEGDKFDYQRMDALFDESAAEIDPAKRLELTRELNDMVMDTACIIPLLHKVQPYVWNKDLNVVNYPNTPLVYEWSWK